MGAIVALMMTGFAAVGTFKFLTQSDFRKSLLGEFIASPVETTFIFALCGCMLLFFWGVFVPTLGTIKVPIMGNRYELWAVAGIESLVGFLIMVLSKWLGTHRSK
ncbi:hypothetical protein BAE36_17385 [Rhizobium leguminosarum bv. trifolii]|uniref:Uncharacterized protein n=1 Tax=Rhizobium leguminosarum bv. trifolii TaxID=386 RepID=A0A1B8RAY9_RHILT|nr:hypothetical protein [Rhizobium leguminosarum]AOO91236.1 hypothetical protein [Rhizobium leguminosarum bv. trifolii]OBY05975.1 hypothetical protein BAE36_17385 [Rhizobium leguminosarum bv. trifolii]